MSERLGKEENFTKRQAPAFLLTAPASGSGKTAAACALMQAFRNMGLDVRAGKCGPDYIDPMYHKLVLGVESSNLDLFFSEREELIRNFNGHAGDADIVVAEGVMGYYDGMTLDSDQASSYDVARTLGLPVLLVLPCRGASLSLAAVVKGMAEFRPDSNIRGILLNRVSAMLYPRLKAMLERELSSMGLHIPVVGYLPKDEAFRMESRHLGLVTPQEISGMKEQAERAGRILEQTVDLDRILEIAGEFSGKKDPDAEKCQTSHLFPYKPLRIGIARDEAFCFYYRDNLELLESLGCELIPFSPLKDKELPPDLDGLLLGGGYPELYGEQLAGNDSMLASVKKVLSDGIPCIAECGGFMYLHQELRDKEGRTFRLVGAVPGQCYPTGRLVRFGYINIQAEDKESPAGWLLPGEIIRGHEFHYWDSTDPGEDCLAVKPDGRRSWKCIHMEESLFAGYPHLYLPSMCGFSRRFVDKCRNWRKGRGV